MVLADNFEPVSAGTVTLYLSPRRDRATRRGRRPGCPTSERSISVPSDRKSLRSKCSGRRSENLSITGPYKIFTKSAQSSGPENIGLQRPLPRLLARGPVLKALVGSAKAMLGTCAGGAVRLADGPDGLVLAEGIETALSLASGLLPGRLAIWSTLSTSGMRALNLPKEPGRLTNTSQLSCSSNARFS
jgi:hypothetical protein